MATVLPVAAMQRRTADPTLTSASWPWLLSGGLTALFAVGGRWDVPLAAWLAPALLLRYARLTSPRLGGLAVWAVSVACAFFWTFELAVPVQASTVLGAVAFGTVFALPYLVDCFVAPRLSPWPALLVFPAARAACEFAMATFSPLGAAYGLSAVTQSGDLALLQVTAVLGPYAIGFLIGGFAAVANLALARPEWRTLRGPVVGYAATLALTLVAGSLRLGLFPASGPYVRVAGLSPSWAAMRSELRLLGAQPRSLADLARIGPAKADAAFAALTDSLFADTRRAAAAGASVAVWSENAAPLVPGEEPAFLERASAAAREDHIYLDVADNIPGVRDETHLFAPDGRLVWTYQKHHPIPGMEPYAPGRGPVPIAATPLGRLANVICYDADFPALTQKIRADILLAPGGDWPQMGAVHTLKMARLRAIESGYALLRQDLNGLSAAFDNEGHVLGVQDTTVGDRHILIADLPARGVTTPYDVIGDAFAWLCVATVLALGLMGLASRKRASAGATASSRRGG